MNVRGERVAWALVIIVSVLVAVGLNAVSVPGAWLLGPMVVSIAFAIFSKPSLATPKWFVTIAQVVIGCVVARAFEPAILVAVAADWGIMVGVVATTVLASTLVGFVITKLGVLPGATAAWGSSPGMASAMVAMSEEYGADPRLVAFMQYLRVAVIVGSTSLVTRFFFPGAHGAATPPVVAVFDWVGLAETVGVASVGLFLGRFLRLPSGALLGPLLLGAALHATGVVRIVVPWFVVDGAYLALGLFIGLRYTRETVRYAVRAFPALLASVVALIVLCGATAFALSRLAHVDGLTAYLATSPGGLDAVAIIAIGSGANVSLVVALQVLRVLVILVTGPAIARAISRYAAA